jgi:hypothetical protein
MGGAVVVCVPVAAVAVLACIILLSLSTEKKIYITIDICTRNLKWTIILFVIKIIVIRNYFGIVFGTLKVVPDSST